MPLLTDVFLVVGIALLGVLALASVSARFDRLVTKIALGLFRSQIEEKEGRKPQERATQLQSIHATMTYPVYASKTILYSGVLGVSGSLLSVYLIIALLSFLQNAEEALRSSLPEDLHFLIPGGGQITALSPSQIFVLLLFCGATFGTLSGGLTYYLRWWYVRSQARKREVLIDESVARTIAFIYALSRSGMVYPEVMRTVAANRSSFGESAEEVGIVVKDMDLFGADLVSALQRIADRTPSEQFADFAENFANVLRSGRNVSSYLHEQYEQYQEERIANQERLLELFTALGEAYVAALVAGPLFLITILLIFGILTGGMLEILQLFVYVLIPLANLGFVAYLDSMSGSLSSFQVPVSHETPDRSLSVRRADQADATSTRRTDGGRHHETRREMNRIRLRAYNRFENFYTILLNPIETVVSQPTAILYVTIPVATIALGIRGWTVYRDHGFAIEQFDDLFVLSFLFVVATFAVVQHVHVRKIRAIESAVPDLLERLASTNEAGMTFTEGLRRVDRSDLGALDAEVTRLISDINWSARTERALFRFSDRIGSSTVGRVVALITNAMTASGNVGPVIRIASDEAREDRRLKRTRRQELFMYVVIIYLSFVVFLGIGLALEQILIPAIPSAEDLGAVAGGGASPVGGVDLPIDPVQGEEKEKYTLLLFHAALVQSTCSGFVAGQMGEGSVKDGTKHVAIMVACAYVLFLFLG